MLSVSYRSDPDVYMPAMVNGGQNCAKIMNLKNIYPNTDECCVNHSFMCDSDFLHPHSIVMERTAASWGWLISTSQ
jgi:hypothetical protein